MWKSFTRGLNPILMDPYEPLYGIEAKVGALSWPDHPLWEPIRRNLGYTLRYANRMDLAAMVPRNDLASTAYCLANPGREYLVYLPDGGKAFVDLSAASGTFAVEWFSPTIGETVPDAVVRGGANQAFAAPFGGDAVLYLHSLEFVKT